MKDKTLEELRQEMKAAISYADDAWDVDTADAADPAAYTYYATYADAADAADAATDAYYKKLKESENER